MVILDVERIDNMRREQSLYKFVYNDILSKIHYGIYTYGDEFPSQAAICESYNVSINTVRKACSMLQNEGYIRMSKGKMTVIVYKEEDAYHKNINILLRRKNAILDLMETSTQFTGIWIWQGLQNCHSNNLETILQMLGQIDVWQTSLKEIYHKLIEVIEYIISLLKNPILSDLYSTIAQFAAVPYIKGMQYPYTGISLYVINILDQIKEQLGMGNFFFFKQSYENDTKACLDNMKHYISSLEVGAPLCVGQKIPFIWLFNRRGNYRYMEIAASTIRAASDGTYRDGCLMPSISQLKRRYDVSSITVRRALDYLTNIGITRITEKGLQLDLKGARNHEICVAEESFRKNLILLLCSIQSISITIKKVALQNFKYLKKKEIESILSHWDSSIDGYHKVKEMEWILIVLTGAIRSDSLRLIYEQLLTVIPWIDCLILFKVDERYVDILNTNYTLILEGLKAKDADKVANLLEGNCIFLFERIKAKLLELGIDEVKDMPCPVPT